MLEYVHLMRCSLSNAVILFACFAVGCSSGTSSSSSSAATVTESTPTQTPEEKERAEAWRHFELVKEAVCEQYSVAVNKCAIESARATMSPQKLVELDLEKTAPMHRAQVKRECTGSGMSPRQVKVMEKCVAAPSCDALVACMNEAQPGS